MGNTICAVARKSHYDAYISYYWRDEAHGAADQLAARIQDSPSKLLKSKLRQVNRKLMIFLDVDDLEDEGKAAEHIDRSSWMLVLCSEAYFKSSNCMRELRRAVAKGVPLVALVDPHTDIERLKRALATGGRARSSGPTADELAQALFGAAPVEWDRTSRPLVMSEQLAEDLASRVGVPPITVKAMR